MKRTKSNLKRRKIVLTSRFYALMTIIIGFISLFILDAVGETDATGPVFVMFLGILIYAGSFGEDE